MPGVSIIIAVYNCRAYLAEAIESALRQSFLDYEIIIINDGSSEEIFDIVEPYLRSHSEKMRYIWQENQGAVAARNRGLSEAKGKYIAFLDCDDVFFPEKLARSIGFLEGNSDYAAVYSDMWVIDEQGDFLSGWLEAKKESAEGYVFTNLLRECFIIPTNIVLRRSALDQVGGFSPDVPFEHDIELWLRFAQRFKIGLIKEPLVKYRQHSQNLSKNVLGMGADSVLIFERYLADPQMTRAQRTILRRQLVKGYFDMGMHDLEQGAGKTARNYFMKAFKHGASFSNGLCWAATFLPLTGIRLLKTIKRRLPMPGTQGRCCV